MAVEQPPQCGRAALMLKIQEIIASNTADPAMEMQAMGKALMEIGQALEGVSLPECRAVMMAVQALN